MLRDAEDAPAAFSQLAVHFPVTFPVACDLGFPEFPIPLWRTVALGTSVPEAPVHEDRQPLPAEAEVGFPWELQMPPPSCDAFLTEELNQHPLRPFVTLPTDQGHHLGSLLLGEDVGHTDPKMMNHTELLKHFDSLPITDISHCHAFNH